jgi:hypothetical protein
LSTVFPQVIGWAMVMVIEPEFRRAIGWPIGREIELMMGPATELVFRAAIG